jgi:hypothetical protein
MKMIYVSESTTRYLSIPVELHFTLRLAYKLTSATQLKTHQGKQVAHEVISFLHTQPR